MNKSTRLARILIAILALAGLAVYLFRMPENTDKAVAESLHGHGSMNVVFAVVLLILAGIFISLWQIEKKVAKLEQDINNKKS